MKKIHILGSIVLGVLAITLTVQAAPKVQNNHTFTATSTPITITGYSYVNTPTNLALASSTREIVVSYSNNHSQITTVKRLNNQIVGTTREIAQLNDNLLKEQAELASVTQFVASSTQQ